MPTERVDVAEAARRIADALDAAGIDYAIGGGLAYAYYGVPRATNDIDLNVFPSAFALPELIAALRAAGCEVDSGKAMDALSAGNDFGTRCLGWRVDVFPPTLELHDAARDRVCAHPISGRRRSRTWSGGSSRRAAAEPQASGGLDRSGPPAACFATAPPAALGGLASLASRVSNSRA